MQGHERLLEGGKVTVRPNIELYERSLVAILQRFFEVDDPGFVREVVREMSFIEPATGAQLFRQGDKTGR
jgi:hypothetical protein